MLRCDHLQLHACHSRYHENDCRESLYHDAPITASFSSRIIQAIATPARASSRGSSQEEVQQVWTVYGAYLQRSSQYAFDKHNPCSTYCTTRTARYLGNQHVSAFGGLVDHRTLEQSARKPDRVVKAYLFGVGDKSLMIHDFLIPANPIGSFRGRRSAA